MSDEEEEVDVAEATRKLVAELKSKREQQQRQKLSEALAGWAWVSEAQAFVRRADHLIWSDKQWRTHFAHLYPKGDVFTFVMRHEGLVQKFERLCFEPGKPEVIDDGAAFNLWRPGAVAAKQGDVTWLLDHITYLFPDPSAAALVLDYLSLLVAEPFQKIRFFLLIVGVEEGAGKTFLYELVKLIIGPHNCCAPTNDEIASQFTGWQEGKQLAVVHELMMVGRKQVANRLKPVASEDTNRIRVMYRAYYETPNRLNCVFTSNYLDALKVDNSDRRWLVVETQAKPREDSYYKTLWGHLKSSDQLAAAKFYLQHREVEINPEGKAPATKTKVEMAERGLADEEAYLLERFEEGLAPFDFDLVRRDDLVGLVQERFPGRHTDLMGKTAALLKGRLKAVKHTRNTSVGDGRPKYHLWSIRNHEKWRRAGPSARVDAYLRRRADFEDSTEEPL